MASAGFTSTDSTRLWLARKDICIGSLDDLGTAPVVSRHKEGFRGVCFLRFLCDSSKKGSRCPEMSQVNTVSSLVGTENLA